jgi:hypothetical protein
MTIGAAEIIQLVIQVGWPLAQRLIADAHNGKAYTAEEWAALRVKVQTPVEIPTGA